MRPLDPSRMRRAYEPAAPQVSSGGAAELLESVSEAVAWYQRMVDASDAPNALLALWLVQARLLDAWLSLWTPADSDLLPYLVRVLEEGCEWLGREDVDQERVAGMAERARQLRLACWWSGTA